MKKEIKTELIKVTQEKHNKTKAQENAMEYSKYVAKKNRWNNILYYTLIIIFLALLFIAAGIIGSNDFISL